MTSFRFVLGAAVLALSVSGIAHADVMAPPVVPLARPAEASADTLVRVEPLPNDGRFSVKRLALEVLAGAVIGGIAGYAANAEVGSDSLAGTMTGLGTSIAVTPLVVWSTGRAFGGKGSLGYTYLGGLAAFAGPATSKENPARFAIGMAIVPVTSALMFELSSHLRSKPLEKVAKGLSIAPVVDHDGVKGARVGFGYAF